MDGAGGEFSIEVEDTSEDATTVRQGRWSAEEGKEIYVQTRKWIDE